ARARCQPDQRRWEKTRGESEGAPGASGPRGGSRLVMVGQPVGRMQATASRGERRKGGRGEGGGKRGEKESGGGGGHTARGVRWGGARGGGGVGGRPAEPWGLDGGAVPAVYSWTDGDVFAKMKPRRPPEWSWGSDVLLRFH